MNERPTHHACCRDCLACPGESVGGNSFDSVHHFDFYRLSDHHAARSAGWDDACRDESASSASPLNCNDAHYFTISSGRFNYCADAICVAEWPEVLEPAQIPTRALRIRLEYQTTDVASHGVTRALENDEYEEEASIPRIVRFSADAPCWVTRVADCFPP